MEDDEFGEWTEGAKCRLERERLPVMFEEVLLGVMEAFRVICPRSTSS